MTTPFHLLSQKSRIHKHGFDFGEAVSFQKPVMWNRISTSGYFYKKLNGIEHPAKYGDFLLIIETKRFILLDCIEDPKWGIVDLHFGYWDEETERISVLGYRFEIYEEEYIFKCVLQKEQKEI